jgi:hypothetical protein
MMLSQSLKRRVNWARKDHFVTYKRAKKTIRYLEWIASQPQIGTPNIDLDSISIIGETGTGKTSIVNYYKNLHGNHKSFEEYETYTVAHCTIPDADLGPKGVFISILRAEPFSYPLSSSKIRSTTALYFSDECVKLLKKTGVRIFFVDEIQHALGRNATTMLNSLKRVLLLSGVPLVPVGVEKAFEIMNLDPQLAERCPVRSYSHLKKWQYDKDASTEIRNEFRKFLAGYEEYLPFPEPSNLKSPKMARRIYKLAHGYKSSSSIEKKNGVSTRQIARLLKKIATYALEQGSDCITKEHLDDFMEEWL